MSRIVEVAAPVTVREKVAPLTEIFWNPETNEGELKFWMKEMVTLKDTNAFVGVEESHDGRALMRVEFSELLGRTFATAAGDVTGAQIMLAFKVMFDQLYAEKFPA